MFAAPPDQSLEWNEAGVEGMSRFIKRLWRELHAHVAQPDHPMIVEATAGRSGANDPGVVDTSRLTPAQKNLRRQVHETIAKVSDDFGRRHAFNTAIAALMELLNAVTRFDDLSDQGRAVRHEAFATIVLLLNPITPHLCHALWQALGNRETLIEDHPWPKTDAAALVRDAVVLAVQVNGKLRGTIEMPVSASREDCERAALAAPSVKPHLEGHTIRKVVVVPGKIVNIVV
jgi:leucyl-tRNA synthetase